MPVDIKVRVKEVGPEVTLGVAVKADSPSEYEWRIGREVERQIRTIITASILLSKENEGDISSLDALLAAAETDVRASEVRPEDN
tara:strand:- start:1830 stop:2084 length:255 start_codon:yes stop_codon:yes gene_type:complete